MAKKVLFVAKNIPLPGKPSNRVVLDIAHRLQERDYEVSVLFPKEWVPWFLRKHLKYAHLYGLEDWSDHGIPVHPLTYPRLPLPAHAFRLLRSPRSLRAWCEKAGPFHLIHAHYLLPDAWMAIEAARDTRASVVVTVRSSDIKLLRKVSKSSHTWRLARRLLGQADRITTLNGPVREFLREHFQVDGRLIPHGIPEELLRPELPEKDIDLIVVAQAIPRKQVDWVIRAFRSFPNGEGRKLVIIGDGPVRPEWENMAGGDDRIQFPGRLPHAETMQWLRRSAIFALPSYQETFGLVYLEAAAAGCALIGRAGEGVAGVFPEGEAIVLPGSYESFERSVHQLLADAALRQKMGKAARVRVESLTWPKVLDRYEALYAAKEMD